MRPPARLLGATVALVAALGGAVALVAALGGAAALASSPSSSAVLGAPAGTPARAAADARALLGRVSFPAGSVRVSVPAAALVAALAQPGETQPYATFKLARAYWTVAGAATARSVLAQTPPGASAPMSTWADGPSGSRGVSWSMPTQDRWIGPRLLDIGVIADPGTHGRWFVMVTAVDVWTPSRLEIPPDVQSVTVTRLAGGAVLARVSAAATIARIAAAVNGLAVDDAVHAVFGCPMVPVGARPGFRLTFTGGSGVVLATASTQSCPEDLSLSVGTQQDKLILGDLVPELEGILAIALPPVV